MNKNSRRFSTNQLHDNNTHDYNLGDLLFSWPMTDSGTNVAVPPSNQSDNNRSSAASPRPDVDSESRDPQENCDTNSALLL